MDFQKKLKFTDLFKKSTYETLDNAIKMLEDKVAADELELKLRKKTLNDDSKKLNFIVDSMELEKNKKILDDGKTLRAKLLKLKSGFMSAAFVFLATLGANYLLPNLGVNKISVSIVIGLIALFTSIGSTIDSLI